MLSSVQNRRIFVAAPLYASLIGFAAVQFVQLGKPLHIGEEAFLTLLTIGCIAMALYSVAFAARWLRNDCSESHPENVLRNSVTVVAPILCAALLSYLTSSNWANLLPLQVLVLLLIGSFGAIGMTVLCSVALFFCIDLLVTKPARWLLNVSPDPRVDGDSTDVAPVPAPQPGNDAQPAPKLFDVEWPQAGLNTVAGMAEFKAEIERFIVPFKGYSTGQGAVADTNGILLGGPAGNGKTFMAEVIAGELKLPLIRVSGQHIQGKWINQSVEMTKALFDQARQQPCVLFIDEFDSVGKSRDSTNGHNEDNKVVTALLTEIVATRKSRVVLVAATNFVDQLDAALIRDGRFDLRIDVPYPDYAARVSILTGLLKKFNVASEDDTIAYVAQLWERRSVAFMEATVKRIRDNVKGLKANTADFKQASREASRKSSNLPKTGPKVSELALTAEVRRETESLAYRLRNWETIAERGGEPPSGVLLYGPTGTGKTSLVRALARELEFWHIFEVNATDVIRDPRKFTDTVEMAANHRPAIIFIDEADELLRDRSYSGSAGATNEILKAMDGMMGKVPEVVFIAATNNAEIIDGAALRGGRFGEKIFMGPLEGNDLVRFLELDFKAKSKVLFADDLTPETLANRVRQAAPAEILGVMKKAINYTFTSDGTTRPVCMDDIEMALQSTQI